MFDELSDFGESVVRRELAWKERILEREQKRVPKRCPFCGNDELLLRFWIAHYFDGQLRKDHADGLQVFCAACEEEIREEDVPQETLTKTDLKEHNIHKNGGVENDE